jgi:hypothetical protein
VTSSTNVYGLYVRSIRLSKWLDREVRDLLERYPKEVGRGTLESGPEDGLGPFTVRGSGDGDPLGDWVLLYVGISESKTPRIVQYFGTTQSFTREPGGQSLHLSLALFFGGGSDPRDSPEPPARSVEGLLRASLGQRLEHRMRDMHLSYLQVETSACLDAQHAACGCNVGAEALLMRNPPDWPKWRPATGWPSSSREAIE